jgi:hypothetical protein
MFPEGLKTTALKTFSTTTALKAVGSMSSSVVEPWGEAAQSQTLRVEEAATASTPVMG